MAVIAPRLIAGVAFNLSPSLTLIDRVALAREAYLQAILAPAARRSDPRSPRCTDAIADDRRRVIVLDFDY
mgnify:CR=1 FL=1